jgi:hypothetical protein
VSCGRGVGGVHSLHTPRQALGAEGSVDRFGSRRLTALLYGCHRRAKILGERHQMADDQIPFVLAGTVVSWDFVPRVLYVGSARLEVARGVGDGLLVPRQRVTVTGHRPKQDGGPWVVTKIEAHRPGF